MDTQFELTVIDQGQTFQPPAYLDKKNLTPDQFIARFAQWLQKVNCQVYVNPAGKD